MPSDLPPIHDLETVSAADLRRNFGVWQERAFAAPVVVAKHGKPRLVLASAEHYSAVGDRQNDRVGSAIAAIPDHSSEGLLVVDRDLRVLAVNHVFEDMANRPAAKMVGETCAALFPGSSGVGIGDQFRHVMRTGAAVRFEAPTHATQGRHYQFTVFPHEHGVAALIVNRTAEAEMQEQLEEYRCVAASFAAVPDVGYVRVNLRAFIESGSPQCPRLLGFDPGARAHLPFTEILSPDSRAEALARLDSVLTGGEPVRFRAAILHAEGHMVSVRMALAPIWRGAQPVGALAFFHLASV